MVTTATETMRADLEIAFEYGKRAAALERFVEEKLMPAYQRLQAAGYDGAWLVGHTLGDDDGPRFEGLEMLRVTRGYPGAANWVFYRAGNLDTHDERRNELDDTPEQFADYIAFDRLFGERYPELERLLSLAVARSGGDYEKDRERLIEGRPYSEIERDILAAVDTITSAQSVA